MLRKALGLVSGKKGRVAPRKSVASVRTARRRIHKSKKVNTCNYC